MISGGGSTPSQHAAGSMPSRQPSTQNGPPRTDATTPQLPASLGGNSEAGDRHRLDNTPCISSLPSHLISILTQQCFLGSAPQRIFQFHILVSGPTAGGAPLKAPEGAQRLCLFPAVAHGNRSRPPTPSGHSDSQAPSTH